MISTFYNAFILNFRIFTFEKMAIGLQILVIVDIVVIGDYDGIRMFYLGHSI